MAWRQGLRHLRPSLEVETAMKHGLLALSLVLGTTPGVARAEYIIIIANLSPKDTGNAKGQAGAAGAMGAAGAAGNRGGAAGAVGAGGAAGAGGVVNFGAAGAMGNRG